VSNFARGEDGEGAASAQVPERLLHRAEISPRAPVAAERIDGDDPRAHLRDAIEHAVGHHAQVGSLRCDEMGEHARIENAKRMIGDNDQRACFWDLEIRRQIGFIRRLARLERGVEPRKRRRPGGMFTVESYSMLIDRVDVPYAHGFLQDGGGDTVQALLQWGLQAGA
jgi:hypothetical protein